MGLRPRVVGKKESSPINLLHTTVFQFLKPNNAYSLEKNNIVLSFY